MSIQDHGKNKRLRETINSLPIEPTTQHKTELWRSAATTSTDEEKGPCPVCGNEEVHPRTGLWTCECPAPLTAQQRVHLAVSECLASIRARAMQWAGEGEPGATSASIDIRAELLNEAAGIESRFRMSISATPSGAGVSGQTSGAESSMASAEELITKWRERAKAAEKSTAITGSVRWEITRCADELEAALAMHSTTPQVRPEAADYKQLLKACLEYGIGEHDMVRCRICEREGHNDVLDHYYGIKHKPDCAFVAAAKIAEAPAGEDYDCLRWIQSLPVPDKVIIFVCQTCKTSYTLYPDETITYEQPVDLYVRNGTIAGAA